ncbi:HvfC/BufC N-terminal domain-containing protein [Paraferrimonas sedimenticola]|uniref:Putative DNA-binding domain-containing protein n=1 Tax=Paraferrimonas sedimenticola TaxID=375674 RepID=A0AA37RU49_9GAMM|nr:DNA-binding domain-containing protein [Paraferrimonas sedimenticola]GLP94859.1 hypothetical protein GCM10007895_01650 [Paraferrimonas sedimenticola]
MPSSGLKDWQSKLVAVSTAPKALQTEHKRAAIYRNNTRLGLRGALRNCYPHLMQRLGHSGFSALADDYQRQHPLTQASLDDYAHGLIPWLDNEHQIYAGLACEYLAQLARLEWGYQACHSAPVDKPNAITDLSGLSPQQSMDLCFQRQANVQIGELSQIATAWADWLPKSLNSSAYYAWVRNDYQPQLHAIEASDYALLSRLEDASSLGSLIEAEVDIRPLSDCWQRGWLFTVADPR